MPRPVLKIFQKKEIPNSMEELKMKICLLRNFAITVIVTGTLPGSGQMNQKVFMIKGNFDAASNFTLKEIVEEGTIVPINELTALYGLGDLSSTKTSYENLLQQ